MQVSSRCSASHCALSYSFLDRPFELAAWAMVKISPHTCQLWSESLAKQCLLNAGALFFPHVCFQRLEALSPKGAARALSEAMVTLPRQDASGSAEGERDHRKHTDAN
eukprot:6012595-Amphidinium_carterae.1